MPDCFTFRTNLRCVQLVLVLIERAANHVLRIRIFHSKQIQQHIVSSDHRSTLQKPKMERAEERICLSSQDMLDGICLSGLINDLYNDTLVILVPSTGPSRHLSGKRRAVVPECTLPE